MHSARSFRDSFLLLVLFAPAAVGCGADPTAAQGATTSADGTSSGSGASGSSSSAGAGSGGMTSTSSTSATGGACDTTPETPIATLVDMNAPGFVLQRSFDQGTLGQSVSGQADGFDDAAGDSVLSDEICYRGGRAAKLQVTEATEAYGTWGGIVHTPALHAGDDIWYRIRTFWPVGSDLTAYYNTGLPGSHPSTDFPSWPGILKFLRLHTVDTMGQNGGYDDVYVSTEPTSDHAFQFIYEGEQVWDTLGSSPSDKIQLGVWETYEVHLTLSDKPLSSGGAGRIRFYKNGKLLADMKDRKTLGAADWTAQDLYIFTYWNNAAPKTEHMFVDDLVVTTKTPLAHDADGAPYIGMS